MKSGRVERVLTLIQLLESGRPRTVEELADTLGVSQRTVYRDLRLLTNLGIPYTYNRASGRFTTERAVLLPPVSLTYAEAFAIVMAVRLMTDGKFIPDQAAATAAALKVESLLPATMARHVRPLLVRTEFRTDPVSDNESLVATMPVLQVCLMTQTKIRVRYDSYFEGQVIGTILHPYRLLFIHRGWYLIAYSELHKEVRTFKVERMIQVKRLPTPFTMEPDFDLDRYFGNAWLMVKRGKRCHVKIRFGKKVAANVDEVSWHKTQRTVYERDGGLLFEADVDGYTEIGWWVLGYGDQARVLEPPELRRFVAGHARSMLQYYGNSARRESRDGGRA